MTWLRWDGDTASRLAGELAPLRPGLTVVICTYRRAASLARAIESIAAQTLLPDALLVVDASPDDETERLAGHTFGSTPFDSNAYFRVRGALAGLTRQRNFSLPFVEHASRGSKKVVWSASQAHPGTS